MTELCEVVITAPDPDWLKDFSRKLIEQRLCASAHNFAPVKSIYRWHGEIYERTEAGCPCTHVGTGYQRSSPWPKRSILTKCRASRHGRSPAGTRITLRGSPRRPHLANG
jgi:hypothetical protein